MGPWRPAPLPPPRRRPTTGHHAVLPPHACSRPPDHLRLQRFSHFTGDPDESLPRLDRPGIRLA
eukprot:2482522-Heterocapsa_arctica.AAC.1